MRRGIVAVIGLYALYALVGIFVHPTFIYPFDQTQFAQTGYTSHQMQNGRVVESVGDGPAVLYFMGNVGALAWFTQPLLMHQDAGRHVVALEYPGGGGLDGFPSEITLKAQALDAYDWLVTRTDAPVIVHGYSLGSSLALHVAANREVAGVVLDAPFARLCEQMARSSALPACWLPGVQKWNSLALARQVTAPVLIQQGVADDLVLLDDAQRVADVLGVSNGGDVQFFAIPGANHNNLTAAPDYKLRATAFIEAITR